jgi:hypothetical protein
VVCLRHRLELPGDVGKLDVTVQGSAAVVDDPPRKHLPCGRAFCRPPPRGQPHRDSRTQ